jgi:hypothetical protein
LAEKKYSGRERGGDNVRDYSVSRMSETYKQVCERRHDRDGESRNRQCWNPKQEYPQELISESTGRKKQCEEQNRRNPE